VHNNRLPTQSRFARFARATSDFAGHPSSFLLAVGVVLTWVITGPLFGFSDTWQLVINTGTTIVTFLMVFLIQNTQNRDSTAMHLKLDELIRATHEANNTLLDLEELSDADLASIRRTYESLALDARNDPAITNVEDGVSRASDERTGREA
jgi:low affinity Fe/Cu permease